MATTIVNVAKTPSAINVRVAPIAALLTAVTSPVALTTAVEDMANSSSPRKTHDTFEMVVAIATLSAILSKPVFDAVVSSDTLAKSVVKPLLDLAISSDTFSRDTQTYRTYLETTSAAEIVAKIMSLPWLQDATNTLDLVDIIPNKVNLEVTAVAETFSRIVASVRALADSTLNIDAYAIDVATGIASFSIASSDSYALVIAPTYIDGTANSETFTSVTATARVLPETTGVIELLTKDAWFERLESTATSDSATKSIAPVYLDSLGGLVDTFFFERIVSWPTQTTQLSEVLRFGKNDFTPTYFASDYVATPIATIYSTTNVATEASILTEQLSLNFATTFVETPTHLSDSAVFSTNTYFATNDYGNLGYVATPFFSI